MMRAAHTTLLGLAALAVAGCGDPKRGEVLVHWTFAGQNCQQAGVHIIQVDVQGEVLTPNQFFCIDSQNNMRVGADIGAYFFGTYNLTVTGLDVDGTTTIYQAAQSFTVNASSIDVNIDLQRLPSTVATADVSWDPIATNNLGGFALGFNGAMTCADAEVDVVRIFVDPNPDGTGGTSAGDVPCRDTSGVEGALVAPLTAGNHSFSISGFRNTSSGLQLVYQTTHPPSNPFQIGATTNVDVTADAVGVAFGAATLQWDFSGAGAACTGNVTYTLTNPAGVMTSPPPSPCGQTVPVGPGGTSVPSGLWRVIASANSGTLHADFLFGVPNQVNPPGPTWAIAFR